MPDYKAMYFKQFRANAKAMELLRKATLETEQMAMDAAEPVKLAGKRRQAAKQSPQAKRAGAAAKPKA